MYSILYDINVLKFGGSKMGSFMEFMGERRSVDRWFVLKVGMASAFFGALLTASFLIAGLG